jgi:DNA polymerase-3 subunit alpha
MKLEQNDRQKIESSSFTHLHAHTEYSLLDGSNKIKEYVAKVKELGMTSAAITDHGEMYGVIDFYKEAKRQGVKPIIGCEVYVAPASRFDREASAGEDRYFHLILLAENNLGYANLMKIVSIGYTQGFYYRPRVDKEVLEKYSEGIIALSACLAGEIPRNINRNFIDEAKKAALEYQNIFGKGNFFFELQDHGMAEQSAVNQVLISMSKELDIGLVATNDIHYTNEEDAAPHEVLLCIQTAKKITDEDRMKYEGEQFYVKSPKEMEILFPYAPEAIENTQVIANRCNVVIEELEEDYGEAVGENKFPTYDVPESLTPEEYLEQLCEEGLKRRYGKEAYLHRERLDFELKTIKDMGFIDYFIIVWDFIKYARDNGIAVGPGRGSAAGSIVSYCLEITNIDPIRYQLLFERFLNPERISLPDIDIDFCYERRQEVIDYVVEKYGRDRVVQIITFGTMAARGVIRDVGRALDYPYAFVDSIAKMIPTELNITIEKALKQNQELKKAYDHEEQVKTLIDMSKRLEGLPRHSSTHAAGVVISKLPVDEYVPLSRSSDGTVTTQFAMNTLEELGLLKMDFLGLRTLTVIEHAVNLIKKEQPDLDIEKIDYNDSKVMEYISTGRTDGIFQIESAGMKNLMKELKPNVLEDLIAAIALYRPGPMDFIPEYIKGKNNATLASDGKDSQKTVITYDSPQLEPILEATYGVIVYQEQVMQIVRDLAGYSLGRSDLLRRAMSKKKADVMEKERKAFVYGDVEAEVAGCVNNGISPDVANRIYDKMLDFAQYAFNKSHAAAYGVVSYQTAWLKYYYPSEFMAALLTSVINNSGKVAEYIYACRQMNIEILPPSINYGMANFTVDEGKIRYGLSAIRSLGRPVIDAIISDREELGVFKNLEDFITRMVLRDGAPNKRGIDSLIRAGAMDELDGTRKQQVLASLKLVDKVQREKKDSMAGQMTLFDIADETGKEDFEIKFTDVGEFTKEELLAFEKEALGVYVTGHPLEEYEEQWRRTISATTLDFQSEDEDGSSKMEDGSKEIVGGMIVDMTIKYTKNNQTMAFITVEDIVGTLEVIVFPRNYEENRQYIEQDSKVFIKGRVATEDDKPTKLICEQVIPFTRKRKSLWIQFSNKEDYLEHKNGVHECLADSEGEDEVFIYLKEEHATKKLPRNMNVAINQEVLARLMNRFGEQMIKVVEKPVEMRF